jgi:hypothetical protein
MDEDVTGESASRNGHQQGDLVALRERLAPLDVRTLNNRQSRAKRMRKVGVACAEQVVEVFDGRAVRKLEHEQGRRRKPRYTAAETNPNLHDERSRNEPDLKPGPILVER